ncbi:MAG: hypothetical protein QXW55_00805 [Candidatus Bathyarchaeia archaeon]
MFSMMPCPVCPALSVLLCSGSIASYLGRILNLQMRGEGFPQRAPNEIIEGEGLSRDDKILLLNSEPLEYVK